MPVNETTERIIFEGVDKITAASKTATDSTKQLMQAVDGVKSVMGALGVTVSIGAFVKLQLDAIAATAALKTMSEQTGAAVETLSAIQRVAKVGGQDFDGLTQQLGRMVRGLKENKEEGNLAASALRVLGISARDTNGHWRDTGEVLIDVANKLNRYADGAGKIALVQDVLGKGAERYIPLLKDIAEGTDLVAKTTAQQAEEAEKAEKAMNRLKISFEEARKEAAIELVPALTRIVEQMTKGIEISGGFGNALKLGLIDPMKSLEQNIKDTQKALDDWQKAGPIGRFFQKPLGSTYEGTEGDLRARLRFLQFQQMQQFKEPQAGGAMDMGIGLAGVFQKPSLDYQSPDLAKEKATRELIAKQEEESAQEEAQIQAEAAAAADRFRATEREQIRKFLSYKLGDEEDFYKVGGAMLVQNEEDRIKALMDAADREQELEIQRGQELLDADGQSYSLIRAQLLSNLDDGLALEQQAYEERKALAESFSNDELDAIGGKNEVLEKLEREHQNNILNIRVNAWKQGIEMYAAGGRGEIQAVLGVIQQMTAGVAQHSRALFEINKVATIATIALKTPEAIASAYAFGAKFGGPPLGAAMAALAAAAQAAQMQAALSTKFGSGTAPSIAGTTAAPAVTPVGTETASSASPRQTVTVVIPPGQANYTTDQLRDILEGLAQLTEDGARVFVERRR